MYSVDWSTVLGRPPAGAQPAAHAEASDGPRARWLPRVSPVVWSLGFTSMLTDISSEMVSSILPMYLVLHLRVSPLAFGIVDGIYQGFAVLLRVAAGLVGDRLRRHKAVAIVGYGLSALCRLAVPAVGGAWTAIAAVVAIDRTGKGIRTAPRDALISLSTPRAEQARAFGVHRSLDAAGAMLGPLAAFLFLAWLPDAFDVIFVVSFCVAALGVAVLVLFVDAPQSAGDSRQERAGSITSSLALVGDRRFRGVLIATGVLSLATMSDAFVFLSLQQRMTFSAGLFPLLFVAVSVVNSALAIPSGRLADRRGRLRVFLGGHALLLLVYLTMLLPEAGAPHLVVCLVLLGGYYAATDGVLAAIAGAALPRHSCGSGLALVATVTNLGRLAASVLFGVMWSWRGLETATALFAAGLGLALVAAIVVLGADARSVHYAPTSA